MLFWRWTGRGTGDQVLVVYAQKLEQLLKAGPPSRQRASSSSYSAARGGCEGLALLLREGRHALGRRLGRPGRPGRPRLTPSVPQTTACSGFLAGTPRTGCSTFKRCMHRHQQQTANSGQSRRRLPISTAVRSTAVRSTSAPRSDMKLYRLRRSIAARQWASVEWT